MIPILTVRYESIIGSYLGETASRLSKLFEYAKTRECVLFFDEFETLGKERGDVHETGEIKRVVSSLLMQIDALPSYVIAIAATNHDNLLDKAIETNWYGKQGSKSGVEVSQILNEAYDEHVREIYSDIKDILGSNEAFGGVIISGGGAILLGEKMKDIVEEHHPNIDVYVPNESQFSNARGFWKLTYLLDF